ncbi:MAG: hypothetical protein HC841_01455, partial [Verrucomicrobiae bacterium]|nr:hypothetical protein [Verrucomicrobiae bacterium]
MAHAFVIFRALTALIPVVAWLSAAAAEPPTVLKPNGGWCWFQGERAIVVQDRLIFTTIAGDDFGGWDAGDLVATMHDFTPARRPTSSCTTVSIATIT